MRIWIAISAYLLLIFALGGMLAAPFSSDGLVQSLLPCLLITALAVHDIIYLRVAKTDPVRGYRHLAAGQFLIGLLISALVASTGIAIVSALSTAPDDHELWQQARTMLALALNTEVTTQQLREAVLQVRPTMITAFSIGTAAIFISQTAFALLVLRKAKPDNGPK